MDGDQVVPGNVSSISFQQGSSELPLSNEEEGGVNENKKVEDQVSFSRELRLSRRLEAFRHRSRGPITMARNRAFGLR